MTFVHEYEKRNNFLIFWNLCKRLHLKLLYLPELLVYLDIYHKIQSKHHVRVDFVQSRIKISSPLSIFFFQSSDVIRKLLFLLLSLLSFLATVILSIVV